MLLPFFMLSNIFSTRVESVLSRRFLSLNLGSPPSSSCRKRVCQSKSPVCILYLVVSSSMEDHNTMAFTFEVDKDIQGASPSFSAPSIGVNPFRGFIRLGVEVSPFLSELGKEFRPLPSFVLGCRRGSPHVRSWLHPTS